MAKNVLQMKDITMQFGGVVAVNNLSLEVNEGEIVSLIGPNGAGKTTAFNVVTGVYAPTNGSVSFNGVEIVENYPRGKMKKLYAGLHLGDYKKHIEPTPDKITKMGIARTFQNIRLWKSQTVFNNVLIAKHLLRTSNVFTATFRLNRKEEASQRAETAELLQADRPRLIARLRMIERMAFAVFIKNSPRQYYTTSQAKVNVYSYQLRPPGCYAAKLSKNSAAVLASKLPSPVAP